MELTERDLALVSVLAEGLPLVAHPYKAVGAGIGMTEDEVIARIQAIARRAGLLQAQAEAAGVFQLGDLRVMPSELRAFRGEHAIPITPRELRVLQVFHERKGRVVDRNTLCDEAWDADYFPSSRALDQCISQLRKKIELDLASPKIIQTVHGAGYRYE